MPLNNWPTAKLHKIVKSKKGKKPKLLDVKQFPGSVEYIDIEAFEKGIIKQYADVASSNLCVETDILVVWDGARFGLIGSSQKGAIGSTLMCLSPVGVNRLYLRYFLELMYPVIQQNPKGMATPHVNSDLFWNMDIPLPTEDIQRQIVERLSVILPKVRQVKARLETIPKLLKKFRQSVLSAACSGRLTEDWRAEHHLVTHYDIVKSNTTLRVIESEIPKEWSIMAFTDVCQIASNLVNPADYQGHAHIAPDNIEKESGKLLSYNTIAEDRVTSPKHLFHSGQIIYSKIRPYLSKAVLVDFDGLCSADMYPLTSFINTHYLLYYILSPQFVKLASTAGERSVLPKINKKELSFIPVPVPSIEEQAEIMKRLNQLFTLADSLESKYQNAMARIDKIERSILSKAFHG
ncbi:MAG: restriction endonuclease subunit S [Candidatus Cloacimonetes bacterium]|nr:restriction endonuclease subunit S [Candidatus Cloacimonadota bacterium]MDY0367274.1 restriction endonuclease subunit S [Candidatus Syntrophosphaera sp.]